MGRRAGRLAGGLAGAGTPPNGAPRARRDAAGSAEARPTARQTPKRDRRNTRLSDPADLCQQCATDGGWGTAHTDCVASRNPLGGYKARPLVAAHGLGGGDRGAGAADLSNVPPAVGGG